MIVKQIDNNRIETVAIKKTESGLDSITKLYYQINSNQGQELIKKHKLIIDPDMEEF